MNKQFTRIFPVWGLLALGMDHVHATPVPIPVSRTIVSAASAWGTAADAWAGYTGAVNIWVPVAVKGGWTLSFRSPALGQQAPAASFWNATANYDAATQTMTLHSPSWGGDVAANSVINIGFNGSGVLSPGFALDNCVFNGQPCVATVMSASDSQTTLAGLQTGNAAKPPPPANGGGTASGGTTTGGGTGTTPPAGNTVSAQVEILFTVNSSWQGGYGANVTVKNLSAQPLPAGGGWQARIRFPDLATAKDVFQSGPWSLRVAFAPDGTVTLSPLSWTPAIAPGSAVSSGFNGGTLANLKKAASLDASVTVVYGSSAGTGGSTPGPAPSPTPTPPPNTPPLPTGALTGNFLFSPYKDVGTSMNWNTNVISTTVGGSLRPLLTAMPSRVPAVTWAFATGECGRENWAGIAPDALAAANVQAFANASRNYVISTGGAAGTFTCSTAAGMRTFINRYASKNLVAVDFDIEAGQSAADIDSLVRQLAAVQGEFPNLRFSFTIATLGSSNGGALASPYGDLSVTGYNVIQSLGKYPLNNYTINLMVMDYGSPGAGVCVVASGRCDMGQTAIQAAINLNTRFGVPFGRMELTPMIGVNDVSDELFSLPNTDRMVAWALSNRLAGLHFWSIDRDTPCNQTSASSTCSSVASVPAWGWTNQFLLDLAL